MRRLKGQLKPDGSLGSPEGWCFVSGSTIAERLRYDGADMMLTIGLAFRNPTTHDKIYRNENAISWVEQYAMSYTFEAEYLDDGYLHVTALSDMM